jgi:hypothetical protein
MNLKGQVVKISFCESQVSVGLSSIGLVVLNIVVPSVRTGMEDVVGEFFPFFPNYFSDHVGIIISPQLYF